MENFSESFNLNNSPLKLDTTHDSGFSDNEIVPHTSSTIEHDEQVQTNTNGANDAKLIINSIINNNINKEENNLSLNSNNYQIENKYVEINLNKIEENSKEYITIINTMCVSTSVLNSLKDKDDKNDKSDSNKTDETNTNANNNNNNKDPIITNEINNIPETIDVSITKFFEELVYENSKLNNTTTNTTNSTNTTNNINNNIISVDNNANIIKSQINNTKTDTNICSDNNNNNTKIESVDPSQRRKESLKKSQNATKNKSKSKFLKVFNVFGNKSKSEKVKSKLTENSDQNTQKTTTTKTLTEAKPNDFPNNPSQDTKVNEYDTLAFRKRFKILDDEQKLRIIYMKEQSIELLKEKFYTNSLANKTNKSIINYVITRSLDLLNYDKVENFDLLSKQLLNELEISKDKIEEEKCVSDFVSFLEKSLIKDKILLSIDIDENIKNSINEILFLVDIKNVNKNNVEMVREKENTDENKQIRSSELNNEKIELDTDKKFAETIKKVESLSIQDVNDVENKNEKNTENIIEANLTISSKQIEAIPITNELQPVEVTSIANELQPVEATTITNELQPVEVTTITNELQPVEVTTITNELHPVEVTTIENESQAVEIALDIKTKNASSDPDNEEKSVTKDKQKMEEKKDNKSNKNKKKNKKKRNSPDTNNQINVEINNNSTNVTIPQQQQQQQQQQQITQSENKIDFSGLDQPSKSDNTDSKNISSVLTTIVKGLEYEHENLSENTLLTNKTNNDDVPSDLTNINKISQCEEISTQAINESNETEKNKFNLTEIILSTIQVNSIEEKIDTDINEKNQKSEEPSSCVTENTLSQEIKDASNDEIAKETSVQTDTVLYKNVDLIAPNKLNLDVIQEDKKLNVEATTNEISFGNKIIEIVKNNTEKQDIPNEAAVKKAETDVQINTSHTKDTKKMSQPKQKAKQEKIKPKKSTKTSSSLCCGSIFSKKSIKSPEKSLDLSKTEVKSYDKPIDILKDENRSANINQPNIEAKTISLPSDISVLETKIIENESNLTKQQNEIKDLKPIIISNTENDSLDNNKKTELNESKNTKNDTNRYLWAIGLDPLEKKVINYGDIIVESSLRKTKIESSDTTDSYKVLDKKANETVIADEIKDVDQKIDEFKKIIENEINNQDLKLSTNAESIKISEITTKKEEETNGTINLNLNLSDTENKVKDVEHDRTENKVVVLQNIVPNIISCNIDSPVKKDDGNNIKFENDLKSSEKLNLNNEKKIFTIDNKIDINSKIDETDKSGISNISKSQGASKIAIEKTISENKDLKDAKQNDIPTFGLTGVFSDGINFSVKKQEKDFDKNTTEKNQNIIKVNDEKKANEKLNEKLNDTSKHITPPSIYLIDVAPNIIVENKKNEKPKCKNFVINSDNLNLLSSKHLEAVNYLQNTYKNNKENETKFDGTHIFDKSLKIVTQTKKPKTYSQLKSTIKKELMKENKIQIKKCLHHFRDLLGDEQIYNHLRNSTNSQKNETENEKSNNSNNNNKQLLDSQVTQSSQTEKNSFKWTPNLTWNEANGQARNLFYEGRLSYIRYNEENDSYSITLIDNKNNNNNNKITDSL